MKNFNKLSVFLFKIIEFIFIIFILLSLAFIAKWRIDHLYRSAIANKNVKFSIIDGIKKTKNDIKLITSQEENKNSYANNKKKSTNIKIEIPKDTDVDALGNLLLENGLIKNINSYSNLMEEMGLTNSIKPGNYTLTTEKNVKENLAKICNKDIKVFEFTIGPNAAPIHVGNKLKSIGMIESSDAFVQTCNEMGVSSFKEGTYKVETPKKVKYIIDDLKAK